MVADAGSQVAELRSEERHWKVLRSLEIEGGGTMWRQVTDW